MPNDIDESGLAAAMNEALAAIRKLEAEELAFSGCRGQETIQPRMLNLDDFPPSWTAHLNLNKKLTGLNQRWSLGAKFRRSWWLKRCLYDPKRNRDISPWLSTRELSLWLYAFEVGLV